MPKVTAVKTPVKETKKESTPSKKKESATDESVSIIDIGRGLSVVTLPMEEMFETNVLIVNDAPLVQQRFGAKQRRIMRNKQQGIAEGPRAAKVPEEDAKDALHMLEDGGHGIPVGSFKAALVESARFVGGGKQMTMTFLKGAIRIISDGISEDGTPLVRMMTEGYKIREDFVRNDSGVADIRYRPQFDSWSVLLRIIHAPKISRAQITQLVRAAGRFNGMGEWRPMSKESKSGSWGTWRLASPEEIKEFADLTQHKKAA